MSVLTLSQDGSVLVHQKHDIRDLRSDRRHVVRVEVVLDGRVNAKLVIHHDGGDEHEDDVDNHDSLLDDLEDDDQGRSGGVDSGANQDQTDQDTDHGFGNGSNSIRDNSKLEQSHVLAELVSSFLGLLPLNEDPSDGNGGVDHAQNGDGLEDTGRQGCTSKTSSSLLHQNNAFLVDGFFITHLNELLIFGHGAECCFLLVIKQENQ